MQNKNGTSSLILFTTETEECFIDASEICFWVVKKSTLHMLFKSGERQDITFSSTELMNKLQTALKNYFAF